MKCPFSSKSDESTFTKSTNFSGISIMNLKILALLTVKGKVYRSGGVFYVYVISFIYLFQYNQMTLTSISIFD